MKAIILAAGRGSRLGTMTEALPKGWVKLGGESLIARQLTSLKSGGVTEIAIVTGYRKEAFDALELPTFHNPNWAQTQMVASLCTADPWLKSEPCIIAYADLVYEPGLIKDLIACDSDLVLPINLNWRALWEARFRDPLSDAESLKRNAQGLLTEIGNPARSLDEIEGQFMGLLKTSPTGWQRIKSQLDTLSENEFATIDMTQLLQRLIHANTPIETINSSGLWLEVDQASDLALYENWIKQGSLRFNP